MPKAILALDLGTTTGWAVRNGINLYKGTQNFKPQRFEGGGMRYLRFRHWLDEMLTMIGEDMTIYFEEVRHHTGVDAAHAYGGFLASLTSWCEEHHVPYLGIPVGTIKKHATGKGNANKQQMLEAIRAKGFEPGNDNEADALALFFCVEARND
jgi:Holliday junction resolvasome RuvABC endonuclease subunit